MSMVKFGWDKLKRFLAQANTWTGQQTFSNVAITGGTITGVVISNAPFTTSTDPASSAATTTAIVNAYNGVLITLTTTGNAQTIASPTVTTAGKTFTVINNDTSTNTITVNGITIAVGKAITWIWDGSAWIEIDLGITSLPVPVNQGGTGSTTASGAWANLIGTLTDYQFIPIDAGIDSILGTPNAAIKVQGTVGNTINPTPANVSYGTFTVNANGFDIDAAIYGSGTQTATISCTGLTIGKLYQLQFTPTVVGQVPTITVTSGATAAAIPTIVTAVVETIYFRATATTAVFTATNSAASTWSTTSTTVKAYSRPAIVREFPDTAGTTPTLVFKWKVPEDISGTTITFAPVMVVSNATAPTTGQTIIFNLAGAAYGDSDSLSDAVGTFVASTYTAPASLVQYDKAVPAYSGAVTITGLAANKVVDLILYRDVTDTYAQNIGLEGFIIKFSRTLTP